MSIVLALLLSSMSPTTTSAQGNASEEQTVEQQVDAMVRELESREVELEEMRREIAERDESATTFVLERELSERRARHRRSLARLVDLLLAAEKEGANVAQGRQAAVRILESDTAKMNERMLALEATSVRFLEIIESGSAEESRKARFDLKNRLAESNRLLTYIDTNLDQRKKLGLEIEQEIVALTRRLERRATMVSGLLQSTKGQIDEIRDRPGATENPEAYESLIALTKHRDVLAETQRLNVTLMDEYGLETAELKQGIIRATGRLSQDVFDKEVTWGLIQEWFEDVLEWMRANGTALVFQVVIFLLILFAFWILARIASGVVRRGLGRSKLNISSLAKDFFIKTTGRVVLVLGLIIAIGQVGVETRPLLAGLGIAGFVIGFALQDTLSNFAAGLMILVYRPFDVGDVVEAANVTGKVDKMTLVSTMVLTFDNQLLIVPNKQVWGGVIRNVTHQITRRVDLRFAIGYSDDIPRAERVLTEIVTGHAKVLKDPEPVIRLHELGESSIDFVVRPWAKTQDYWEVYWDITREVKRRFDEAGISIPFPQRDVHIHREGGREET